MASPPRKIAPSGAGRKHTARGSLHLLPGGADTGASPDWSESEGQGSTVPCPSLNPGLESAPDGAEGSAPGWEIEMGDRSWVRLDRFALADVRREHRLTPAQLSLLLHLSMLAEYRPPHLWSCTLHDIGEFTGLSRNTITTGLKRLEAERLIAIHEPFRQRSAGLYEVLAYNDLILPSAPKKRSKFDRNTRPIRTDCATDQGFDDDPLGIEGRGGIYADESLTRGVGLHDEALGGAYRRLREAFPGAEEVS